MAKKGKDSKKGHNRLGGVNGEELKVIVERIEALDVEKAELANDRRDVLDTAKAKGFDIKTINKVIKLRKVDAARREEEETLLHTYMHALGMLPLFENANDAEQITEGAAPP